MNIYGFISAKVLLSILTIDMLMVLSTNEHEDLLFSEYLNSHDYIKPTMEKDTQLW